MDDSEKILKLVDALKWYADKANWTSGATIYYDNLDGSEGSYWAEIGTDCVVEDENGYDLAQEVLRELGYIKDEVNK